jgi:alkyldihydroxyacetonephosphate synthase
MIHCQLFLNLYFFPQQRCQPASLRLMDNQQFQFGQALRPSKGPFGLILDGFKNFYLTRLKGLDIDKICVATIVMEGTVKEVAIQEEKLTGIGLEFQGIPAGEHNGKRGYQLTFAIAYIRVIAIFCLIIRRSLKLKSSFKKKIYFQDIGLDYGVVAESFETSVPWDRVVNVVNNTKSRLEKECSGITTIKIYRFEIRITASLFNVYFY